MGSERMAKYIVKRVIMALITILVVACVTFVLMMSVPVQRRKDYAGAEGGHGGQVRDG